jgi:hypothetical protein
VRKVGDVDTTQSVGQVAALGQDQLHHSAAIYLADRRG